MRVLLELAVLPGTLGSDVRSLLDLALFRWMGLWCGGQTFFPKRRR